jgi:hypothetical protein
MNMQGWFRVATLAGKAGVDLWNYQTPKGVSLKTAFDWLLPFAMGEKKWDFQQISAYNNKSAFYPLLLQAAMGFKDQKYLETARKLDDGKANVLTQLLYKN